MPSKKRLAKKIKMVQARATKLLPHLRTRPYPDRLKALGLPSLEYRRERADMVQIYKLTHGLETIDSKALLPPLSTRETRGHRLKLEKQRCSTSKCANLLRFRAINNWNSLPEDVVNAPSLNSFKERLNKAWHAHPYKFNPSSY